jgi:hypothetical protein
MMGAESEALIRLMLVRRERRLDIAGVHLLTYRIYVIRFSVPQQDALHTA